MAKQGCTTKIAPSGAGSIAVILLFATVKTDWQEAMFATRWFVVFLPLLLFWSGAWICRNHSPVMWTVASILLAASRAIGETMIVVMAAGLAANLTANPFEAVTTVTVQIVTLLVGDQEFDSPKTLAAFALGLVLFLVTLALNIVALHVVRKYREQYE